MKKLAFTMLELVFVIVVIGIIAAMVIPRIDRDNIAEAANQMVNHIKYTQHLAMNEDVYSDTVVNWFRRRWQIELQPCGGYSVYSDTNMDTLFTANEAALDPQTKLALFTDGACQEDIGNYAKVSLQNHYDIGAIGTAGCGGTGMNISFDNLGRPYDTVGLNGLLKQNCDITLTAGSGNGVVIRIVPETGYTYILNYF